MKSIVSDRLWWPVIQAVCCLVCLDAAAQLCDVNSNGDFKNITHFRLFIAFMLFALTSAGCAFCALNNFVNWVERKYKADQ